MRRWRRSRPPLRASLSTTHTISERWSPRVRSRVRGILKPESSKTATEPLLTRIPHPSASARKDGGCSAIDRLERTEEAVERPLLVWIQVLVLLDGAFGLAGVAGDCVLQSKREAVVHEPVTRSQTPQRRRSDLARGRGEVRGSQDGYSVAGADIMQQKVTVRMDGFV